MTLHCNKINLKAAPKNCKLAQVLSYIDGNMQCDKNDSVSL